MGNGYMRRRSETLLGLEDDVCLPTRAARCRESAQRRGVNAVGVQYCTDTGHLDGGQCCLYSSRNSGWSRCWTLMILVAIHHRGFHPSINVSTGAFVPSPQTTYAITGHQAPKHPTASVRSASMQTSSMSPALSIVDLGFAQKHASRSPA